MSMPPFNTYTYAFPWADASPDIVYVPEEWVLKVSTFESGIIDGTEFERIKKCGETILKIKKIRKGLGADIRDFPMKMEDAKFLCRLYLTTVDRKMWPTLLGINSAMDAILGQKFKGV